MEREGFVINKGVFERLIRCPCSASVLDTVDYSTKINGVILQSVTTGLRPVVGVKRTVVL